MQAVTIDLRGVRGASGVLTAFGRALYFGGATQSQRYSDKRQEGWGFNWSAMNDCLAYLPEGGIWGTAPKYKFPLHLKLLHNGSLRRRPRAVMLEILKDTQALYAAEQRTFTYSLEFEATRAKEKPAYLVRFKKLFNRSTRMTES